MSFSRVSLCPACGTGNRVPAEHLSDTGRCGSCKAPLPPLHEPLAAGQTSFDDIVRSAKVPVLVDFWAGWCGPCRALAPELHALAKEMAGRVIVLKVDTEAEQALSSRYQIRSIPHLMVFHHGSPVAQRSGSTGRAELRRWVEAAGR